MVLTFRNRTVTCTSVTGSTHFIVILFMHASFYVTRQISYKAATVYVKTSVFICIVRSGIKEANFIIYLRLLLTYYSGLQNSLQLQVQRIVKSYQVSDLGANRPDTNRFGGVYVCILVNVSLLQGPLSFIEGIALRWWLCGMVSEEELTFIKTIWETRSRPSCYR